MVEKKYSSEYLKGYADALEFVSSMMEIDKTEIPNWLKISRKMATNPAKYFQDLLKENDTTKKKKR